MNLDSKIRKLENTLHIGQEITPEMYIKYKIVEIPDYLEEQEALTKHIQKMTKELKISFEKAKELMEKIEPFYIFGVDKII